MSNFLNAKELREALNPSDLTYLDILTLLKLRNLGVTDISQIKVTKNQRVFFSDLVSFQQWMSQFNLN